MKSDRLGADLYNPQYSKYEEYELRVARRREIAFWSFAIGVIAFMSLRIICLVADKFLI